MLKIDIANSPVRQPEKWLRGIGFMLAFVIIAFIIKYFGSVAGVLILLIPFAAAFTVISFNKPIVAVYVLFFYSFFVFALGRYVIKDFFPAGILFDGLLVFAYLILLLKGITGKVEWARMKDAPFVLLAIWLIYCMLSLTNQESPGFDAWILSARSHLYMVLSIPLFCLLIDAKSLKTMIILWGVFSMIMTLKGFAQQHIGLDAADHAFLSIDNHTHMLWGKLRVFSFCSDAGQFGVQQAHAATLGAILFLGAKNFKQRIFFLFMALTGVYGMFVSGTRGAIFVVLGGALAYCALIRNTKLLILGVILAGGFYGFMRYTYIGSNIYAIHRMRTALHPSDDPSYMVRINNQKILRAHLASRPFGGGLGSMEHGAKGSLLKEIPHDSGYVLIWGDQGIVGLCMFIGILLVFLIKGTLDVWFRIKNEWLRGILIALIAGISGDAIANYGNPVLMQHPTCILFFFTIAVIYAAPRLDKSLEDQVVEGKTPTQLTKIKF